MLGEPKPEEAREPSARAQGLCRSKAQALLSRPSPPASTAVRACGSPHISLRCCSGSSPALASVQEGRVCSADTVGHLPGPSSFSPALVQVGLLREKGSGSPVQVKPMIHEGWSRVL